MLNRFFKSPERLLWVVFFFVILISAFLITQSYRQQVELVEQRELAKLEGIAVTLSLMVNGDEHQELIARYAEMDAIQRNDQDSTYLAMHNLLRNAQEAHRIENTIYTMVYDESKDKFCYGVASSDTPFWKHAYRDYPDEMLENYTRGGKLSMYEDSNGVWLSAFHPIRNANYETVGILQVDEKFDEFIEHANQSALKNALLSLAIALVIMVIFFFILRSILNQQKQLQLEKEELETLRRELLANVSHDLRTPLSSVQGYLETALLMGDADRERRTRYLETALQSAEKLRYLIDELFDLSKLESRDRKPNLETFSLAELATDVAKNLRIQASKKNIQLKEDISPNLVPVCADLALIDRVLQNVIGNAIKFTPDGGTITLKLEEVNEEVCIHIIDSGSGIAPEELETVFERFNTGTGGEKKGSGLGLAIVKSILEAHNAPYKMESKLGEGTHFLFCLPKA